MPYLFDNAAFTLSGLRLTYWSDEHKTLKQQRHSLISARASGMLRRGLEDHYHIHLWPDGLFLTHIYGGVGPYLFDHVHEESILLRDGAIFTPAGEWVCRELRTLGRSLVLARFTDAGLTIVCWTDDQSHTVDLFYPWSNPQSWSCLMLCLMVSSHVERHAQCIELHSHRMKHLRAGKAFDSRKR